MSDFRGGIVILDFWATWCGPCQRLAPILAEIEEEYSSKGVAVVGVNQRESAGTVRSFVEKHGLKSLMLLDKKGSVGGNYGATGLPTLVIVDQEGNVRETIRGFYPEMKDRIVQAIEPLL
ncbi:MAG: TlpA family protein disulfide reductase [Armatimonadetes bacterium]|nr:TlpA family protein disulfide reductase [Armatimonadota bacterium]